MTGLRMTRLAQEKIRLVETLTQASERKWQRTEVGKEEEEELAKTKVEWDGMSTPRVDLHLFCSVVCKGADQDK